MIFLEKVARTSKKDFYIGNPKAKYEDWAVSRFTFGAIRGHFVQEFRFGGRKDSRMVML
jgi:hypothetical protein